MKYMGSKNRIAKELLKIILPHLDNYKAWVEPFVGGGNLIDKIPNNIIRIGADINPYLIDCLKYISNLDISNQLPINNTIISESTYKKVRDNKDSLPKWVVGYFGFALSYGGKFFGGWCRDSANKRDYVKEAYSNAIKQQPLLKDVNFICSSYNDLTIPDNSLIYCDPPYSGTTKYASDFDHNKFWQWVRIQVSKNHLVFVSEYQAPSDFIAIWSKSICSSLTKQTGELKGVEKLFIHKDSYNDLFNNPPLV